MTEHNLGFALRVDRVNGVLTADFISNADIKDGDSIKYKDSTFAVPTYEGTVRVMETRPARGQWKGTPPTWQRVQISPQ